MIKLFDLPKLAYCASFMDGEGYIEWTVREKKNGMGKKHLTHVYRMEICNTDIDLIQSLHDDFGQQGSLFKVKPRTEKHQPQLRWGMSHQKLYRLLKLITPFMREKRKINKAKEIIKWVENRHTTTKYGVIITKNTRYNPANSSIKTDCYSLKGLL